MFVSFMKCSAKSQEKPKERPRYKKEKGRSHSLLTGPTEKESKIPSSRLRKDNKGRAIPLKRQASLSPMPRANGQNLLIRLCCMTPGKPTAPPGTGILKTTGKKLTQLSGLGDVPGLAVVYKLVCERVI